MNNLVSEFAARFAAASLSSLVDSFNRQVGNRGFNSARAAHDVTLVNEFVRRGIDVSAVSDGHSISFAHHIQLDPSETKLMLAGHLSSESLPPCRLLLVEDRPALKP